MDFQKSIKQIQSETVTPPTTIFFQSGNFLKHQKNERVGLRVIGRKLGFLYLVSLGVKPPPSNLKLHRAWSLGLGLGWK